MTPTNHNLGIMKHIPDCLGRRGIRILPMDGNMHSLLFGLLKCYTGSKTFRGFGSASVQLFLNNLILALLAEMMIVEESTGQVIPDCKCGIFAVPATCLPRTIGNRNGIFPRPELTLFHIPHFLLGSLTHFIKH